MSTETPKSPSIGLIVLTVISAIVVIAMVAMPYIFDGSYDTKSESFQLVHFIGRFHPVVLHLPIGILVLVALMEVFNLLPGSNRRWDTRMPLFFAALTAVQAVVFGFLLFLADGSSEGELMNDHLWGGIIFGCLVVGCFVAKMWASAGFKPLRYLVAPLVFVSCAVMGYAAHQGAGLVHGPQYLVQHMPESFPEWSYKLLGDGSPRPDKAPTQKLLPSELPVFAHVVTPILAEKCNYCHGEDKANGKLRMDSIPALLAGGAEGPVTLIPGDASASLMIQRIHLPLDDEDDEHMPPPEKDQLEDFEIAILEYWINSGAKEHESLVEMNAPLEIIEASNQLLSEEEREALEAAQRAEAERLASERKQRRAELNEAMVSINEQYPGALTYVSQDSDKLTFTAVSMREKFGDEDLKSLAPVADAIVSLDISSASITDASLPIIESMNQLTRLKMPNTQITDAAIDSIVTLNKLTYVNLYGTEVTDDAVMKLADLPELMNVYLWQTKVTEEGAAKLQEALRADFAPDDKPLPEVILGS